MNISKLYVLMGGNGEELYGYIRGSATSTAAINRGIKQYDPKLHDVTKPSKRPDKEIYVPTGEKDPITGEDKMRKDYVPPARAPLAIQKYIINQKGSFARGTGVILKPTREGTRTFEAVSRNWTDNKTDFYLKDIFVAMKAETQVAVVFFGDARSAGSFDDFRFKFKILAPTKGDTLEPFYDDETDDMIAFGREYEVNNKTRYDFYYINEDTGRCEIRRFEDGAPMWEDFVDDEGELRQRGKVIVTPYKKLPIVYWEQSRPECDDTEEIIKEFENGFNDFLTQMGYSADPILFAKGKSLNMPPKGQAGKYIDSNDENADLKYVTPDNATESRDLQFKLLVKYIFTLNRAVLLDLDTMKELGDVSGAALERYLLDAYMEATDNQMGAWGLGVQRMINWLLFEWKRLIDEESESDLRVDAVFTRFNVRDELEKVTLAMKANGEKPVIDHEQSIALAGLADDPAATLAKIEQESASAAPETEDPEPADPAPARGAEDSVVVEV